MLKELYPKLVHKTLNEQELEWLKEYFNTGDPKEMYRLIRAELALTDQAFKPTLKETAILARVAQNITNAQRTEKKPIKISLWPRMAVAVAVAVVIFGAGLFYFGNREKVTTTNQYANDVAPGKNGATLTLANGKVIKLSDAQTGVNINATSLTYSDGSLLDTAVLLSSTNAKDLTAATANGQTYLFTLPDGTKAWLNAASTISFPAKFTGNSRTISLTGEAYFEVAKDKSHPFIVKTANQEVEVLGTHFNINSYVDEKATRTTLLEGSVRVHAIAHNNSQLATGNSQLLKPGQQSTLSTLGALSVAQINAEDVIAWTSGKFVFEQEDITSVMRKLSRWYNVEVVYEGNFVGKTFTGSISRYDHISKILDKIKFTEAVHFKIEGRRVTIMP
ncbi:MAG TPA: FecR domain-containing protein [Pedobacter sp.]|nr:FecR domain-containing protein [Pedobacter sp.]